MAKPKQNTQRLVVYISPELEKSLQEEAEKKEKIFMEAFS